MRRWSSAAVACGVGCVGLLAVGPDALGASATSAALAASSASAGSGLAVKVTPNRGLVGGEAVTLAGRGLSRSGGATSQTWFVIECTDAVHGRMDPATDTAHCDVTAAQAIKVAHNGTFSTTYHVVTGIVGDGYCGTPGHLTCVLSVGTAAARGTVVRIAFRAPTS
jgi:hypothetical protein